VSATTEDRLKRILAMVPWIVAHDGPSVAETCERFGCTPPELMRDIQLLYMCGLYPYTPDLLIEASVVDGRVYIEYAEYFSRPLRLTPGEGLGLVAAASALLAAPGTDTKGPLARGLAKLAGVLGGDDHSLDGAVEVELGATDPAVLVLLRAAAAERRQVTMRYYSFGRDDVDERIIEPASVFRSIGEWYVHAWCHRAHDERTFRVDRIERAELLESTATGPAVAPSTDLFVRKPETGTVVLDLRPSSRWVAEQYPVEERVERPDGVLRVRLAIAEWAWLDRLVLRLGADATVVDAPPSWPGGGAAAARVLARYGE
jgi:proteasome accessory factor C